MLINETTGLDRWRVQGKLVTALKSMRNAHALAVNAAIFSRKCVVRSFDSALRTAIA